MQALQRHRDRAKHLKPESTPYSYKLGVLSVVEDIEQWAREKEKDWNEAAEELHRLGEKSSDMRIALFAQAHQRRKCISDIGVPEDEFTHTEVPPKG